MFMTSPANSIKHVFFDFDGTIVNSLPVLVDLYNEMAPKFKCKTVSQNEVEKLRNLRPQEFMGEYGVKLWKLPFMVMVMRKKVSDIVPKLPVVWGIIDVIHSLKKEGVYVGILTTNSKKNIQSFLAEHMLEDKIDSIVTFKHVFAKDRAIQKLIKNFNINPKHMLYIGDETRDVEAAKKAGIVVWAASWGFQSIEALKSAEPHKILIKPADILEYLSLGTI